MTSYILCVCMDVGLYVSATVLFLIIMNLCLAVMYKTQDKIAGDEPKDVDGKIQVKEFMMVNYNKCKKRHRRLRGVEHARTEIRRHKLAERRRYDEEIGLIYICNGQTV